MVQIASTGEGKSISFFLPAYVSATIDEGGVTVVVVPLVALQDDLVRRADEYGIESYVWRQRQKRIARLIFVTPESATSKSFYEFVQLLHVRQLLDRVVVDECHMLLDGTYKFRP